MILHSTHMDRVQIESSSKAWLFSLCSIAVSAKCLKCIDWPFLRSIFSYFLWLNKENLELVFLIFCFAVYRTTGRGKEVFIKTHLETMCRMDWRRGLCRGTRYERNQ